MTDAPNGQPPNVIPFPGVPPAGKGASPKAPPPTGAEKYDTALTRQSVKQRYKRLKEQRRQREGEPESEADRKRRELIQATMAVVVKEITLDKPREAFRPFKTLILTDGQKRGIRRTHEFRRFRGLASDNGRTLCLNNECRAVGRGNVWVEIAASHPVTADRAKFSATVDGGGQVIEAETLDDAAINAEYDRARAG